MHSGRGDGREKGCRKSQMKQGVKKQGGREYKTGCRVQEGV